MTIEGMVSYVVRSEFEPVGCFHINWVRLSVFAKYGISLSYKQVRNALYRGRVSSGIAHIGLGVYGFVFPEFGLIARRRFDLFCNVVGGIYYRRLLTGGVS